MGEFYKGEYNGEFPQREIQRKFFTMENTNGDFDKGKYKLFLREMRKFQKFSESPHNCSPNIVKTNIFPKVLGAAGFCSFCFANHAKTNILKKLPSGNCYYKCHYKWENKRIFLKREIQMRIFYTGK